MFKSLYKETEGFRLVSILTPLCMIGEVVMEMIIPKLMSSIIDDGVTAGNLSHIYRIGGWMIVAAAFGLLFGVLGGVFGARASTGYARNLRRSMYRNIQTFSFANIDKYSTAGLVTRMTTDVTNIQNAYQMILRMAIRAPSSMVIAMIMAFTVNVRAAWIFVVAIPLLSIVVFGVMVITNPLYKTAQTRLDRVLGLTRENLTGVRVVRAFDKEKSEIDRFESANDLLTKMQLHVGHISSLMSPLTYVIINLAIVALLYVGSIEINIGGMAAGDVIALVNYMNQILVELVKLANLIVQVSKALACASRVQAVLDTEPGMEFPTQLQSAVDAD